MTGSKVTAIFTDWADFAFWWNSITEGLLVFIRIPSENKLTNTNLIPRVHLIPTMPLGDLASWSQTSKRHTTQSLQQTPPR